MTSRIGLTLGLVAVTMHWGFTFVSVQNAIRDYSVLAFLVWRFGTATLGVAPFALRRVGRLELRMGAVMGTLLALGLLVQTIGLRTTSVTNSGLIIGLYVIFTPLFAMLLFRARTGRQVWAAIALSLVGLSLVAGAQPGDLRLGDGLTLVAAALFGAQIALLSRYAPVRRHGADARPARNADRDTRAAALAVGVPFAPPRPDVWWAIAITGLGASAFAFWMQTYAQQRIPAARAAVIMAIEPVWAAIAGYLFAGDRLTEVQWIGAGLMLLALLVAEVAPYVRVFSRRKVIQRAATGKDAG
ncbi:MAG: DMT family transporter [Chloroflexia bacterium]